MYKILTITLALAISTPALACDGTCKCGGVPQTPTESATSVNIKTGAKFAGYVIGGAIVAGSGGCALIVAIPELCVNLSADQRAYNRRNGIKHSRKLRGVV